MYTKLLRCQINMCQKIAHTVKTRNSHSFDTCIQFPICSTSNLILYICITFHFHLNLVLFMMCSNSVRIVTSEDLRMSRYSLSDVILPLVGVESKLPLNRVGER